MASKSARKKRVSALQTSQNRSASLRASPNVSASQVTTVEERNITRRLFNNSSFSDSIADYTCNESFDVNSAAIDVLPKTDYTYARSGSYSPRHLRKKYVNPNMSRRRLRGVVTPPVSMLEDSDSDDDLSTHMDVDQEVHVQRHLETSTTSNHTYSNVGGGFTASYERDELEFDSDDADSVSDSVGVSSRVNDKERAEMENRMIQHSQRSADSNYRHYYEGMVLRSGSHLKGVKRFLDEREPNRRKSTSVISTHLAGKSADVQASSSASALYNPRRRSDGTAVYTTTITKTVTEIEEESVDVNNSAHKISSDEETTDINNSARVKRGSRARSRSRSRKGRRTVEYDDEYKQTTDAYQDEKRGHRLNHLYGLDHSEEFSDSDTYSNESLSDPYLAPRVRANAVIRFFRKIVQTVQMTGRAMHQPFLRAFELKARRLSRWVWKAIVNFVAYFILFDAWILSRRVGAACCMCLPLLLLPLLLGTAYYGGQYLPSPSAIFMSGRDDSAHIHKVDATQTVNLRYEVRQILSQLQTETREWLTKSEVEALIRSMLNPEMESLRVTLLNVANEGSFDQSTIKVDQQDAKLRLTMLEEQMAVLLAKAKNLEHAVGEGKATVDQRIAGYQDKHAASLAEMKASLAALQLEMQHLQDSLNGHVAKTKKCCMNETAVLAMVRSNVNSMISEMVGGKDGTAGGSSTFAGWLQDQFVDHGEFERQLRILTADITDKISSSMGSQRGSHGSSIVLPGGNGYLSEEAVRLIVEDALLKYSADRTGLPDYALESAGGSVISVRCSETYYKKTALISVFGIPLWYTSNSPRTVVQPEVHPGQCWAFKGTSGYIVIQLAVPIRPTAFSLEHIPKSLSMTGSIDSAPRDFIVFGLESEKDTVGVNLGNYTYQTVGRPIQHFDVQISNPGVFNFVELRVMNNHGNKEYTCLYRFRVHGVPQIR